MAHGVGIRRVRNPWDLSFVSRIVFFMASNCGREVVALLQGSSVQTSNIFSVMLLQGSAYQPHPFQSQFGLQDVSTRCGVSSISKSISFNGSFLFVRLNAQEETKFSHGRVRRQSILGRTPGPTPQRLDRVGLPDRSIKGLLKSQITISLSRKGYPGMFKRHQCRCADKLLPSPHIVERKIDAGHSILIGMRALKEYIRTIYVANDTKKKRQSSTESSRRILSDE